LLAVRHSSADLHSWAFQGAVLEKLQALSGKDLPTGGRTAQP
jgi:hypothetical protein